MAVSSECWATIASTADEALQALVWARGLRRLLTSRKLLVIASPQLSDDVWEILQSEFDVVVRIERRWLQAGLDVHTAAKAMAWGLMKWRRIALFPPNSMIVRQCEEIFQQDGTVVSSKYDAFVFSPCKEVYGEFVKALESFRSSSNGSWISTILKHRPEFTFMNSKFDCNVDLLKEQLATNLKDLSTVCFPKNQPLDIIRKNDKHLVSGFFEKALLDMWCENLHYVTRKYAGMETVDGYDISNLTQQIALDDVSFSGEQKLEEIKDSIAIIGMSCRFPGGGNSLDEFWDLLINGKDAITKVPEGRWIPEQLPKIPEKSKDSQAGFLQWDGADKFDGKFFGISPMELEYVDPQQRLILLVAWEALEEAGLDATTLHKTRTGVYAGQWRTDYRESLQESGIDESEFLRSYLGNSLGVLSARISHCLGLTGPAVSTESGCSSSIVAVDLACKALLRRETDLTLACGVNLLIHPFTGQTMNTVLAPDGRCKTFDASADGFGRAEGCGVLVLKRFSDAVRDGDNIWALIRGSAVVQEGASKSLGTPTVYCESLAMDLALKDAGVEPNEVSFVEMHGTGTPVGDPLEVMAVEKVYSKGRTSPLIIGSVKTNIGHTESCSGIAGIIKVVLALKNEAIPPHINFKTLNPYINLDKIPAEIPFSAVPWKRDPNGTVPRIAGVSSFGITGTDAHVIIQETPEFEYPRLQKKLQTTPTRPVNVLCISAKNEDALVERISAMQSMIEKTNERIEDIVHSANTTRAHFQHRAALVLENCSKDEVVQKLKEGSSLLKKVTPEEDPKICFLFTGQGSQYPGMAKDLYDHNLTFKIHFDQCDKVLKEDYGIDMKSALWGENSADLSRTLYSQTSIFCVEYCLLKLWSSWGVKPDFVLGHSLGEFAAAVGAGILSFKDALKLVAERSHLIDALPRGKMLVLKEDKERTDELIKHAFAGTDRWVDFAATNSPEQTVVAGSEENILAFAEFCKNNKVKCIVLEATHAFHSRHMDPVLDEYRRIAETVQYSKPKEGCVYVSGMEGRVLEEEKEAYVNADYWVRHTRDSVRFSAASRDLMSRGCCLFLEVGPQPVLSALTMINSDGVPGLVDPVVCLPSIRRQEEPWSCIMGTVAKLYLEGVSINWEQMNQFEGRKKVPLPFYPFQNKSFWFEIPDRGPSAIHPLVGAPLTNATTMKLFQNKFKLEDDSFLRDHVIGSKIIFPGAGFMEMCLVAGHSATQCTELNYCPPLAPITITDFAIESPLCLVDKEEAQLQVVVAADESGDTKVTVYSKLVLDKETQKWIRHASATFSPFALQSKEEEVSESLNEILESFTDSTDVTETYDKLAEFGLKFGPTFQTLKRVMRKGNASEDNSQMLFEVKVTQSPEKFICHPVVMDALFQAIMITAHPEANKLHVPVSVQKFVCFAPIPLNAESCYIFCQPQPSGDIRATLYNVEGDRIAQMFGAVLMETTVGGILAALEAQKLSLPSMFEDVWRNQLGPSERRADLLASLNYDEVFDERNVTELSEQYNALTSDDVRFKEISNRLYALYMVKALENLLNVSKISVHETISVAQLMSTGKVLPGLEGFVRFMLLELEKDGMLKCINHEKETLSFEVTSQFPFGVALVQEIELLYSESLKMSPYETQYVSSTGKILADILTGKHSALPLLFPEDPTNVSAESYYMNSRLAVKAHAETHEFLSTLFKDTAESLEQNKSIIRILEVGAGTGSFTKTLLAHLTKNPHHWEFTYTDLSPVFFAAGEKVFENSRVKVLYRILNIEEDIVSQEFLPHHYDIIIANNVVHATKSIAHTSKNLRNLLSKDGILILSESVKQYRGTDLTFGLLDAYWHYEDYDLRGHYCELPKEKWCSVLHSVGYEKVVTYTAYDGIYAIVTAKNGPSTGYMVPEKAIQSKSNKVWWIFGLDEVVTQNVQEFITSLGHRAKLIDLTDKLPVESDFTQLKESLQQDGEELEGVVYLWGLKEQEELNVASVCEPFLYLCKTIITQDRPKLFVVTRNTISTGDNEVAQPASSPLWAMAKCFQNEQPNASTRCIDIDDWKEFSNVEEHMKEICSELIVDDREIYVAYRDHQRLVPRFLPWKPQNTALSFPKAGRFKLMLPASNAISDLKFGPNTAKVEVGPNDVECLVKSYALNFRDVFAVIKPSVEFEQLNTVGIDWSGVVTSVGENVSSFKPGDAVFSTNLNGDALPSHSVLNQDLLMPVPESMTFNEAATIPAVAATAYLCFMEVAKLKKEDTVLIHTASGGVGLVAIQIAQAVGAKIVATAGNKRKRAYLRNLGIEHVFHSRNTSYEKEIRDALGGRGVDVVLNSLTSAGFKEASLALCNEGARFVEMSKLNTWTPEEVKALRPDVNYTIVDLSASSESEMKQLITNIKDYMKLDVIKPIPYSRFDASEIREALTYLQKAKHIGKIVVTMPDPDRNGQIPMFNDRSTYLITGGLGGIGMEVAKWMVQSGAKNVALVGRNPPNDKAAEEIKRMNSQGANVFTMQFNVGEKTQCREMLDRLSSPELALPPLRGIMHAAGVLSDAIYVNQSWEKYCTTYNPKVQGGWNLHQMTKGLPLEHFVMFSSGVASFGSMGQSNHASANFFLDSLAYHRHFNGLPATTVNWGQWGQVGVAANIEIIGLKPFSALQGISALEKVMKSQKLQTCVCYADFAIMKQVFSATERYVEEIKLNQSEITKSVEFSKEEFWNDYDSAKDDAERTEVVRKFVRTIIRQILKLGKDEALNDDENFQNMGMDSLMMIEMKNVVQSTMGNRATITVNSVKDCHTVNELAIKLCKLLGGVSDADIPSPTREELKQLITEDSVLPDHIRPSAIPPCKPSEVKTVLITGVTGNMGPYFLRDVSKMSQISKIYCLIRGSKDDRRLETILKRKGLHDQVDSSKVTTLTGDVNLPMFGLSEEQYNTLAGEVDAVIHLAIKSNFIDEYKKIDRPGANDIRTVNVKGTLTVLDFLVAGKTKLLFHASSIVANATVTAENRLSENWPGEHDFDHMPNNAYSISKHVCERFLATAVLEHGLPVKVFRFPAVGGESSTGANVDYENNQLMLRLMSYLHLGYMPALPLPFFILPVDNCVTLSLALFFNDEVTSDIFNVYNPYPHNETELKLIGEELGKPVEVLEPDDFQARLAEEKSSNLIHFLKEASGNKEAQDRFLKNSPAVLTAYLHHPAEAFVSDKLTTLIPDLYPKTIGNTLSVIRQDLQHAKESGVFAKFGLD